MEVPKPEPGRWNHTAVVAKKPSTPKKIRRKHAGTPKKVTTLSTNHNPKSPKCLIKITGSRYNGTFLVSVDPTMDDAIYKTMREIEVGLGHQLKRKPSTAHLTATPKSCLTSVFKCFSQPATLQYPKNNCFVESKKNMKSRVVEGMPKRESHPVWAKLPKEIEPIEGSNIKKFKSSSFKFRTPEKNDVDIPRRVSTRGNDVESPKTSQIQKVEESSSNLREKKNILNSDDRVVTVRAPKTLSCYECSALEIGLEVKPKVTTREVSQVKEEVQIEDNMLPQVGCRILQNRDKRSLYVTIEEDVEGNPSLKLAFTGGKREDKNMKTDQRYPHSNDDYLLQADLNDYVQKTHGDSTTDIKHRETTSCRREENKSFKSVEVQVSGKVGQENDFDAQFHKLKTKPCDCSYPSKLNSFCLDSGSRNFSNNSTSYKRFPYKLMNVFRRENPNAGNGGGSTAPETVTKMNRTPYLVHRLYDPTSTSPSRLRHIGAVYRMMEPQNSSVDNSRISKKTRLDDLSCSSIKNIDTHRYTQYIDEECYDYHPKRDFGMSTSKVDDFEKVLQNICGPSYWYHRSETSNLSRLDEDIGEKNCYCSASVRKKLMDLNCNRGNQTENSNGDITKGQSELRNVNLLKERSFDKIYSDDTHDHSNADLRRRKIRTVHTCTDADLTGRKNIGHLVLDTLEKSENHTSDLEALNMAKNEFLNKFKSFQIGGPQPSVGCCTETAKQDGTVTGSGCKKDIANCEDISFEVSPLRLGGGLYLKTRKRVVSNSVSGYTSSDSTSNYSFRENQMNVINMTSNGMRRDIGDEMVEGKQQALSNSRHAIKIKSRSCQDIFVSRNLISTSEVLENVIPRIAERRCQCFTAARSEEGLGYGIVSIEHQKRLERGVEKSKLKDYNASHLEKSSWRFQDIPPEIGSLFLQRPSFIGASAAQYSDICKSQSAYRVSLDRLSTVVNMDQWCPSNATQVINSHTFVGPKKKGVFQRTILTIRKKITSLFGKKVVEESTRNFNQFTFNKHDKIVFIPVPLEKKYENIHLFKKKEE